MSTNRMSLERKALDASLLISELLADIKEEEIKNTRQRIYLESEKAANQEFFVEKNQELDIRFSSLREEIKLLKERRHKFYEDFELMRQEVEEAKHRLKDEYLRCESVCAAIGREVNKLKALGVAISAEPEPTEEAKKYKYFDNLAVKELWRLRSGGKTDESAENQKTESGEVAFGSESK